MEGSWSLRKSAAVLLCAICIFVGTTARVRAESPGTGAIAGTELTTRNTIQKPI
jgi:hypothetical protein